MDTNLIIRNEHKAQIAAFGKETRLAIDEAISAYNALVESTGKDAAAMARRQAVAVSMIAEDKEALDKAGFETFKDAALALVHLSPSNATQYRKAGDFIRSKDAPAIVNWYSPSALYEFTAKKIPTDTINAAIKSGELKEDMPFAAIRAWCEAHNPKALTDGEDEVEVVPMFTAHITPAGGETYAYDGTLDEIRAEMWRVLSTDATMDDDRFGTFNPHATEMRGKREVKGKGIALVFGVKMVSAVYFPLQRAKSKSAVADTIAAQNATIEKLMAELAALKAQQ